VTDAADGDHYILAKVEGGQGTESKREFRTKHVYSSATPIFNVRWTIKMEHFRSAVVLHLMDARTHRSIASTRLSVFQLMQRDADRFEGWADAGVEKWPLLADADSTVVGYIAAKANFEEDSSGLFKGPLHDAPEAPKEELSVQRLSAHIARFTAIFDLINMWFGEYDYLMSWKDPITTLLVLLIFLYCSIFVKAEYALSCVVFIPVAL
jgi:hypothetical protein